MSAYEQPFSEFEERYFLAEILKRSNFPPATLLAIIRDARIEPAWNDIALPHGRSVSACQQAYSNLYNRVPVQLPQPPQLPPVDPSRGVKRPYASLGDTSTTLPRELQPRPPGYTGLNGQQVIFPQPAVMSPVAPQRKKRGRPTKAEFERRQAEAHERGEVWPKPRKAKVKQPPTEAAGPSRSPGDETRPSTGIATGSTPSEAGPSSAGILPPVRSPGASSSVSGGPVQTQLGTSHGPEGPGAASPRPTSASDRVMEGIQQHARSGVESHVRTGPHPHDGAQSQHEQETRSSNTPVPPPTYQGRSPPEETLEHRSRQR